MLVEETRDTAIFKVGDTELSIFRIHDLGYPLYSYIPLQKEGEGVLSIIDAMKVFVAREWDGIPIRLVFVETDLSDIYTEKLIEKGFSIVRRKDGRVPSMLLYREKK